MDKSAYLIVKQKTSYEKIPLADLEYLESLGRKTLLHMGNREMTVSARLSQLEKQLPSNLFFRCHQGYIFNMDHVARLQRSLAFTDSGAEVPVSRTFQKKVRAAFLSAAR